jgi:hypothetical protein
VVLAKWENAFHRHVTAFKPMATASKYEEEERTLLVHHHVIEKF